MREYVAARRLAPQTGRVISGRAVEKTDRQVQDAVAKGVQGFLGLADRL